LSGAGKTTLGKELTKLLRDKGERVVFLDGDQLREVFGESELIHNNHDKDARLRIAFKYSRLCRIISNQELTVVIATISLFKEIHIWNRDNLTNYFEVLIKVPINELRLRDPKGIYKRFDDGELKNVAGLDLNIDEPKNPNLVFDFNSREYSVIEMIDQIMPVI
jgi:adenylylsulfate kinase